MVKTYRFNGCKDGERSSRNKEMLCFFDSTLQKIQQALVLSNLDYCSVGWSSAERKDLVKLQLAQNRAACLALHCKQMADINTMHASLSTKSWGETECITSSFYKKHVLKIPNCLHSQLTHSSDKHLPHQTCHQGSFTVPKSRTNSRKCTVLYRAMIRAATLTVLPPHRRSRVMTAVKFQIPHSLVNAIVIKNVIKHFMRAHELMFHNISIGYAITWENRGDPISFL